MGDPRRSRKTYLTPLHPWRATRIQQEKDLTHEFGFVNKRELWKMATILRNLKSQAKRLIAREDPQSVKEEKALKERAYTLALIEKEARLEDILGLDIKHLLQRRLQTQVQKLGYAKTAKQSRQFIVHGHVLVNGKKMNAPSYLVKRGEEGKIMFKATSSLASDQHPERRSESSRVPAALGKLEKEEVEVLAKMPKREAPPEKEVVKDRE